MDCPTCEGSRKVDDQLCPKCRGRGQVADWPRLAMFNDWLGTARPWQEHVLRYACTIILVWAAWSFCAGLGEDTGSTSSGLLFAVLFTAVPAGWLWGREFHEARIRYDRKRGSPGTTRWTAAPDAETETTPRHQDHPVNQGEPWRVQQTRGRGPDSFGYDMPGWEQQAAADDNDD